MRAETTLKLNNSASFAGTVAGMTGHDTIDFADIDPSKVQTPSHSGNAAGGTLTVTDGMHTANIALLGNYLASTFVPSSDGHGGTSICTLPGAAADQSAALIHRPTDGGHCGGDRSVLRLRAVVARTNWRGTAA